MSFLSAARDKAIVMLIQRNDFIKKFGEVQDIDISSDENRACVTVLLHGETKPTTLCAYYHFEDSDEGTIVVINKIESEREMINVIAAWWFKDNSVRMPLPKGTGVFAKILF